MSGLGGRIRLRCPRRQQTGASRGCLGNTNVADRRNESDRGSEVCRCRRTIFVNYTIIGERKPALVAPRVSSSS